MADLWELYQNTFFAFPNGVPQHNHFAVITAWNPASMKHCEDENSAAQQRLMAELNTQSIDYTEVIAGDQQFDYFEPSLACGCTQAVVERLCRQYGQNAYYWFENHHIWLVPVLLENHQPVCIGTLKERLGEVSAPDQSE